MLYGALCSSTVTLGKVSSRKALSASACISNSSGVPRSVIVGRCTVQYSIVTTSRLWRVRSLPGSAWSGPCRLGSLTLVKSKTSLVCPSGAARSVGRLRVLAAGAVDGRPRLSTRGIERVDGLHCSFPVDPNVTNRSQPFVVAQIERAEAEEALRTPLRPSGLLAAAADAIAFVRETSACKLGAELLDVTGSHQKKILLLLLSTPDMSADRQADITVCHCHMRAEQNRQAWSMVMRGANGAREPDTVACPPTPEQEAPPVPSLPTPHARPLTLLSHAGVTGNTACGRGRSQARLRFPFGQAAARGGWHGGGLPLG